MPSDQMSANPRAERPWMKSFGALRDLRGESARIAQLIDQEFERPEAEDLEGVSTRKSAKRSSW